MTTPDLTAAIDAAADALRLAAEPTAGTPACGPDEEDCFRLHPVHFVWAQLGETGVMGETKTIAKAVLTAALPHLRRAFAEEAARAVEAHKVIAGDAWTNDDAQYNHGLTAAARIVRKTGATDAARP